VRRSPSSWEQLILALSGRIISLFSRDTFKVGKSRSTRRCAILAQLVLTLLILAFLVVTQYLELKFSSGISPVKQ